MKQPFSFSAVLAATLLMASATSGLAQDSRFDPRIRVDGAVMTLYSDHDLQPIVILRAKAIFADYQRKGFFRIGVLPLLVFEGFNVEVCDAQRFSGALTNTISSFMVKGESAKAVEARNFSLTLRGQSGQGVTARLVRLVKGSEWQLQDGTIDQPGAASCFFHCATLIVAGPEAGQLIYATTNGLGHLNLLSLTNAKHH